MSESNVPSNKVSTPSQPKISHTANNPDEQTQAQQSSALRVVVLGSTHTPEPESPPISDPQDPTANPTNNPSEQSKDQTPTSHIPPLLQPIAEAASGTSSTTASSSAAASTSVSTSTSTGTSTPITQEPNPAAMSSTSSSSPGNTGTSGPAGSTTSSSTNPAYHLPYAPFPFRMPDGTTLRGSGGSNSGGGKGK